MELADQCGVTDGRFAVHPVVMRGQFKVRLVEIDGEGDGCCCFYVDENDKWAASQALMDRVGQAIEPSTSLTYIKRSVMECLTT